MEVRSERVIFDGKEVVLREEIIDKLAEDEILIKAEWSQVSIGTEIASIKMAEKEKREIGLGYSLVGIVERKGEKVKIEEGERILALAPHASYVKVKAIPQFIVKVPEGVSPDIATVGILGSVAFHIVERANVRLGESVGVLGQGVVGSLCMQIAKICGAKPVIAIDIDDEKLEIAKEYGADLCLNPDRENIKDIISEITDGKMLDVVIEATGKASPVNIGKEILGWWGRLVLSSYTNDLISFALHDDIVGKELTIIGAHQPKCPVEKVPYYPFWQVKNRVLSMEYLRDGILKIEKLISHRIAKKEISKTYSELIKGNKKIKGVLIEWK
ncbi:zinc-binding dehydrogenase [bacterium]|nr:zinc-binding dehydrogenase [bacterium]